MTNSKPNAFTVEAIIPVNPDIVFDAWLSSEGHEKMTGAGASATAEIGGINTAWDGYITSENEEVSRPNRFVQRWRTAEFTADEADSRITVEFFAVEDGTRIVLTHENLPAHGGQYEQGWQDHYFTPMTAYFSALTS